MIHQSCNVIATKCMILVFETALTLTSFVARAPPRTQLGELTTLPEPPSWLFPLLNAFVVYKMLA